MATYNATKSCIAPKDAHHSGRAPRMPFGHDAAKDDQISDYRDKMAFDDVIMNDVEMAKYAVKNSKRYKFNDPRKAMAFVGRCVQMTLNHCGLMVLEGTPPEILQKKMDAAKIQIESRVKDPWGRTFYKGDDLWRNGIYIFKNGELVAFVSNPLSETPSAFSINRKPSIYVVTNAKIHTKGFR